MLRLAIRVAMVLTSLALLTMILAGNDRLFDAVLNGGDVHQETVGYAERIFDGVVPFDAVLSSRHRRRASGPDCAHAFVRLTNDAPSRPPATSMGVNRDYRFGGVWRPTPASLTATPVLDLLEFCRGSIGSGLTSRIAETLGKPGAFYSRDLTDGALQSTRRKRGSPGGSGQRRRAVARVTGLPSGPRRPLRYKGAALPGGRPMKFLLRLLTWWNSQTLGTQIFTWRKGQKVGEDAAGNIFYQTRDGKRRWVIFNGESEASRITPDWHGWLHFTWNQPPTVVALAHKAWEKPHVENLTGSALAYAPAGSLRRAAPPARRDYEAWSPEQAHE